MSEVCLLLALATPASLASTRRPRAHAPPGHATRTDGQSALALPGIHHGGGATYAATRVPSTPHATACIARAFHTKYGKIHTQNTAKYARSLRAEHIGLLDGASNFEQKYAIFLPYFDRILAVLFVFKSSGKNTYPSCISN
jgi:hypothetical protein